MTADRTNSVHHVYRCYDESGRLIYVGSSLNLFGRLATHRNQTWWAPQVTKVVAKVYPNGVVAREAERKAIRTENPRWNKYGRWSTRHSWTRDDWDDWLTLLIAQACFPTTELRDRLRDYRNLWGAEPQPNILAAHAALVADREAQEKKWAKERDELAARRSRRGRSA